MHLVALDLPLKQQEIRYPVGLRFFNINRVNLELFAFINEDLILHHLIPNLNLLQVKLPKLLVQWLLQIQRFPNRHLLLIFVQLIVESLHEPLVNSNQTRQFLKLRE